jgi:cell division protein FtsB
MGRVMKAILPGLVLLAAYSAVFGGEYSLFELRSARAAVEVEREALAGLEQQLDSLAARADSLRNDEATLERVAREQFGMIREGETLYRFAAPADEPEVPTP